MGQNRPKVTGQLRAGRAGPAWCTGRRSSVTAPPPGALVRLSDQPPPIQRVEPRDHVAQAPAAVRLEAPAVRQARPIVRHQDPQPVAVPADRDVQAAGVEPLGEPVLDGVLDKGLEGQHGKPGRLDSRLDPARDAEPIPEPHLLDGQVLIEQVELLLQR